MALISESIGKIGDFFDSIQGATTNVFNSIHKFFLQLQLVGLNFTEILLFVAFIFLMVAVFIAPARLFIWLKQFETPIKRVIRWLRT